MNAYKGYFRYRGQITDYYVRTTDKSYAKKIEEEIETATCELSAAGNFLNTI